MLKKFFLLFGLEASDLALKSCRTGFRPKIRLGNPAVDE
jgi:hypothetical protein